MTTTTLNTLATTLDGLAHSLASEGYAASHPAHHQAQATKENPA